MPDDPKPGAAGIEAARIAEKVLQDVLDIPVDSDPEQPEFLLVRADQLTAFVQAHVAATIATLTARAEAAEVNSLGWEDAHRRLTIHSGEVNANNEALAARIAKLEVEVRRKDAALRIVHQDLLDRAENGQVAIGNSAWAALANAIIAQPKEPS